ncbi:MAG: hypothetical protein KAV87_47730 [Desulfobacteraceae bacterium]|nr:hypothetical protein [Desulfobacteraceae bacterium]
MTFDSGRGVYIVAGHPNCYYHDGYFYRVSGGVWEMSMKFKTGWGRVSGRSLPKGLQAKQVKAKVKASGNGKVAKGKGKRKR